MLEVLSIHATNFSLSRLINAECDDLKPSTGTKTSCGGGCGMRSLSSKSITFLQLPSGTQNTGNYTTLVIVVMLVVVSSCRRDG